MKRPGVLLIFSFIVLQGIAQKRIRLFSPDKQVLFSFELVNRQPAYGVSYKGKPLLHASPLGLQFEDFSIDRNINIGTPVFRDSAEDYPLVVGKTSKVHHPYHEAVIPFIQKKAPHRQLNLVVKAFNDGLAFRYDFPQQKDWPSYTLVEERSAFRFSSDPLVHTLFLPSFTTSHEGIYSTLHWKDIKEDTLMDMPTLFEFPNHIFMAVTEAALLNYAGMYLVKHQGILTSRLSPLPGQNRIKVKATLPHGTPWRVLLISDRVGALIESNILTSLSPPCRIDDVSWIKPGKTTFPWWNGNITPDTSFAPGNNFETAKYYIDFCARNRLQYHSVVEYGGHEWYMNDGDGFAPGPHADVTTPVPTLHMQEICDYAKEKGVDIRVWVHWAALYPKLDTAFRLFEQWGIKGMMVDFMDRDDQQMVTIQEEILQKAARYHLHIQFHGAYKPTGLNRTYPNEFTREGTRNYEVDKWDERGASPDHDIMMPFTRMLAGSTDYHLGGFRAVPPAKFKVQYTRPLVLGTRCHMLAMYVVLENYLGMVCDYPSAYEGQPGFDFIKAVPTTWDETKVPDAKVGEYIVVARRRGRDWFIGIITNHTARTLDIPLGFLEEGTYLSTVYSDAPDTDTDPNHLLVQSRQHTAGDYITLHIASGGGAALWLKKN